MKKLLTALLFLLAVSPAWPADQAETIAVGARLTLAASADGSPAPDFQWSKNGTAIPGATGAQLVIASLALADSGAYTVTAKNELGAATSDKYVLTVGMAPSKPVIKSMFSVVTVEKQSAVQFRVVADGTAPMTYQWLRNGLPMTGKTDAVLTFTKVNPSYTGRYSVNVANVAGKVSADIVELRVR